MTETKGTTVREIVYGSDEYQQMVQLRYNVLRAPLGLNFTEAFLDRDKNNLLVAAFADGEIIGCCLLEDKGESTYQLRQMAVAFNQQGYGIGKKVVQFAEALVKEKGSNKIELHAREVAKDFYLKAGYTIEGEPFEEIGIPHFMMVKNL